MISTEERCPTCEGSGFVARNDQRLSCPTFSPKSDVSGPYLSLSPNDLHHGSALHIARSAAYVVGAGALFAVLALLITALWH
jgi:hypothetical protein